MVIKPSNKLVYVYHIREDIIPITKYESDIIINEGKEKLQEKSVYDEELIAVGVGVLFGIWVTTLLFNYQNLLNLTNPDKPAIISFIAFFLTILLYYILYKKHKEQYTSSVSFIIKCMESVKRRIPKKQFDP
jgi:hypothetical protein